MLAGSTQEQTTILLSWILESDNGCYYLFTFFCIQENEIGLITSVIPNAVRDDRWTPLAQDFHHG